MAERKRLIAPSILSADFSCISAGIKLAEEAGADCIHADVMDGNFVPPITFGTQMIQAVRKCTKLPLDVHLMVVNPAAHIEEYAKAGADYLTVHIEAEVHIHRLLMKIRSAGMKAGIALVPSTPVSAIAEILDITDQVIVMTVNPGYGGQNMIFSTLEKVRVLADMRKKGAGDYSLVIDGGFCAATASRVWEAGTDTAVMGSAFYHAANPAAALKECRNVG
ncbi:MAG: ribulose-phosphate 3-epimerase [Spirochaeta sp. LUC14_002_19_P3]|nr:MAG: ribulose-phosphate 3-epimerase [Spirochaeta sp. LUC14_002_19_P3]